MLFTKAMRLVMAFFILWAGLFISTPTSMGASLDEEREVSGVATGYYSARITWTTDEPSTSHVDYGKTGFVYESTSPEDTNLVTRHEIILTNLEPSTLYHYRIRSKDMFGNEGVSQEFTFKTMDLGVADNTAPRISNIKVASVIGIKEPTYISDDEAATIIGAGPAAPGGNFPGGKVIAVAKAEPEAKAEPRHVQEEGPKPTSTGMTHSAGSTGQLTKHEAPVEKTLV
ncbi:MAG: fibronectin type III domain-containing protein, partial [Candidatus Gorgyraea atricola]|nr:fibronectin type III domain-containing protein [Candidatus Gorgyraea atricola]